MTTSFPSRRLTVHGVDTFRYDVGDGAVPILCLHGNLDSADAWAPLLARAGDLGRVIAPDLPSFGRSRRLPDGGFDATLDAYVDWFAALVDALGLDRYQLVVHDWGSLALPAAARRPDRVARIVAMNVVPLTDTYRWHWIARLLWRPRILGELGMPVLNRFTVKTLTRLQRPGLRPLDPSYLDRVHRDLTPETKRAILTLYRTAGSEELARHGATLRALTCPTHLIWGRQDPYVGTRELPALAAAFGGDVTTTLVDGGHWPMLDSPEAVIRTAAVLRTPDREARGT